MEENVRFKLACGFDVPVVSAETGKYEWASSVNEGGLLELSAGWETSFGREQKSSTALRWNESAGIEALALSLSFAVRLRGRTGRGVWLPNYLWVQTCTTDDNKIGRILKNFQLCDEALQFKFYKIQWKACHPVDFRKIRHYKTHAQFTLAYIVQATIRITTVLCKHCVESAVESLMWRIEFVGIHYRPYFVVLRSLGHRI